MSDNLAISFDDILSAAKRLEGHAVRTPLLEFAPLNERLGKRVLIKFEGAQHTGSFKFRGAFNRISTIDPSAKSAGVVAWSSGNHAQGIAAAASMNGIPATIVMPSDAPKIKVNNTRALGADIIFYDRYTESREEIAMALVKERGAILVPSYDDPFIIAGQGTVGLEIAQQAEEVGATIGAVIAPCGGGGLISGTATAIKEKCPEARVYSAEPEGFDSTGRSLASDTPAGNDPKARSICDALQSPYPGTMTLPINKQKLAGGLAVSDDEVRAAVRFAFEKLKLVAEPGGSAGLAAALAGKIPDHDGALAIVISGANVDPELYCEILSS
ncbi:threonine dehydratase [Cohaesibacter marisflavi]|uniref:Threonine dehydratase n=1 Tax=Cohaesibacter marisflavi TaxID=655353 RepID=A0A1I5C6C9_9HYPH|nr:threonine/serine dehydratase [Cohaesibacter marisflavi]SFN82538.1 threonine dehydratase [Cohaesibacter marisflavi]